MSGRLSHRRGGHVPGRSLCEFPRGGLQSTEIDVTHGAGNEAGSDEAGGPGATRLSTPISTGVPRQSVITWAWGTPFGAAH